MDTRENLLLLRVGGVYLAVPAASSEGIAEPPSDLGAIPGKISGLFPHGGHAFALIDLRTRFGLAAASPGRVVLSQAGGQRRAFVVDEVVGNVGEKEFVATPLPLELPRHCFTGAMRSGDRIVLRTDLERLMAVEPHEALNRYAARTAQDVPAIASERGPHTPLDEALTRVTAELRHPEAGKPNAPPSSPRRGKEPKRSTAPSTRDQTGPYQQPKAAAPLRAQSPSQAAPSRAPSSAQPPPVIYPTAVENAHSPSDAIAWRWKLWGLALFSVGGVALLAVGSRNLFPPERTTQTRKVEHAIVTPVAPATRKTAPGAANKNQKRSGDSKTVDLVIGSKAGIAEKVIIHKVIPGDTLWSIAEEYIHDPWAYRQLAKQSGISNPNDIKPGDEVRIIIRSNR